MQKIYVLKDFKSYKKDATYMVGNNEAHSLIDGGYAVLFAFKKTKKEYPDKMMRSKSHLNNLRR